jgi:hypothetical protein
MKTVGLPAFCFCVALFLKARQNRTVSKSFAVLMVWNLAVAPFPDIMRVLPPSPALLPDTLSGLEVICRGKRKGGSFSGERLLLPANSDFLLMHCMLAGSHCQP